MTVNEFKIWMDGFVTYAKTGELDTITLDHLDVIHEKSASIQDDNTALLAAPAIHPDVYRPTC